MEYVYAALVLHSAGKEITEEGVKAILEAAGIEVNEARVKALVSALEDVNIDEAIEKASFAPVTAPAVSAPAVEATEEKKEEEAEEEEEEKKEEEAIEGLGALFG